MWQTANLEALTVTDYSLAVGMMGNEALQVSYAVINGTLASNPHTCVKLAMVWPLSWLSCNGSKAFWQPTVD